MTKYTKHNALKKTQSLNNLEHTLTYANQVHLF